MPRHAKFPVTIQAHVTVPKKIGNVSFFYLGRDHQIGCFLLFGGL